MKNVNKILLLIAGVAICYIIGAFLVKLAHSNPAIVLGTVFTVLAFIPRGATALRTDTPDLSALTTAFIQFGGRILRKHVNKFDLGDGITMYRGVKVPQVMTKLSAVGGPGPYSAADSTGTAAAKFTDRTLYVRQSKWDFDIDPEVFRNKYLALYSDNVAVAPPFYQFIIDQIGTEYMSQLGQQTAANGVYNATGTTPADIADGYITILKREVTATNITALAIGAISSSNAVSKVEQFAQSQPAWWRAQGFTIKCSYAVFDAYKANYRTVNTYGFKPNEAGKFALDGFKNVFLEPVNWIPNTNTGLLGVVFDAMAMGTDGDAIQVAASMRRNIIELRLMMPIGFEFEDLDCISVSDILVA